jgi:hypothetical protein
MRKQLGVYAHACMREGLGWLIPRKSSVKQIDDLFVVEAFNIHSIAIVT